MNKPLEGKLVAHDLHQFELKLDYTLDPHKFHNNYKIELYYFIPKSLDINRHTYSKKYFFNDIQGYIRFKTPTFSFAELVDLGNTRSPLTKVATILKSDSPNREKLISEIKLYACCLRVAVRGAVTPIRRLVRKQESEGLEKMAEELCTGVNSCLMAFRDVRKELGAPQVHEDVRRAFRQADEYLGVVVDDFLNSINNTILDSNLNGSMKRSLNETISKLIISEFKYRKECNYLLYVKDSENEHFLYRKGLLKKLITSILFLETHTQEGQPYMQDFFFATAAGLSMVIATVVTLWAGQKWGGTSLPFVLAIVIGYMLKDRIKDWLKLIFTKKMTRWLSDYKTDILDPESQDKIGVCRQAFSFITEKNVPPDIMELRRHGHHHSNDFWIPEDIIKYEKDIMLKPGPIIRAHTRLNDITDIVRFNIQKFLYKMDDPYEIHRAYDIESGNIIDYKCARVYHANIVMKLVDEMRNLSHLRRIRLVLDQTGLQRVEEVK